MAGKSELKINSKFAEKYEKYRQKEELQRRKCEKVAKCANVCSQQEEAWCVQDVYLSYLSRSVCDMCVCFMSFCSEGSIRRQRR